MTDEPSGSGRERRRFERVPLATPVIVVFAGQVETYHARDVCPGGVFLYAQEAPPVGSQVRIEFMTARDRRFLVSGTVLRDDTAPPPPERPGFAVAFDAPGDVQAEITRALQDDVE